MTKSRDCGYQRSKAHRSPTGACGRSPVVADFRFAPCLNDGGITQIAIGRNWFHSARRLRPYLRIATGLAEQYGQQYEPNEVPGASPNKRLMARICSHLTIILLARGSGLVGMMCNCAYRDSTLRCANISSFRFKYSSKAWTSAMDCSRN